jgi:hypothetical protein
MVLAYDRKFEIADFWPRPNAEGNVNIGLGINPPLTPIRLGFRFRFLPI